MDYAELEARVTALMVRPELERAPLDAYRLLAALLMLIPYQSVTPQMRQEYKRETVMARYSHCRRPHPWGLVTSRLNSHMSVVFSEQERADLQAHFGVSRENLAEAIFNWIKSFKE